MTTPVKAYSQVPAKLNSQLDFILLDGSSSMTDKWWDMLSALDAYVDGLKAEQVHSHIVLTQFSGSHNVECVCRDESITDWKPTRQEPFGMCSGGTALYDAIYMMGLRLRDLDPPKCAITIVTDGGENGSTVADRAQAKSILDWCRAKGWQVTFIGANFDNSTDAEMLGGHPASAIGVEKRHLSDATRSLAKKRVAYGATGAPMHWSDNERQQFGGYLGGPSK